jgi:hypothetical protein
MADLDSACRSTAAIWPYFRLETHSGQCTVVDEVVIHFCDDRWGKKQNYAQAFHHHKVLAYQLPFFAGSWQSCNYTVLQKGRVSNLIL